MTLLSPEWFNFFFFFEKRWQFSNFCCNFCIFSFYSAIFTFSCLICNFEALFQFYNHFQALISWKKWQFSNFFAIFAFSAPFLQFLGRKSLQFFAVLKLNFISIFENPQIFTFILSVLQFWSSICFFFQSFSGFHFLETVEIFEFFCNGIISISSCFLGPFLPILPEKGRK